MRLNPGRDVRAYVRHLIKEENTASSLDLSPFDRGKQDFKRKFGFEPRKRAIEVYNGRGHKVEEEADLADGENGTKDVMGGLGGR